MFDRCFNWVTKWHFPFNYLFSFSLNVGMKWKCPRVVLLFWWVSIFPNYCHSCHLISFPFSAYFAIFHWMTGCIFFAIPGNARLHSSISTWLSNFSVCNDIPSITHSSFISWQRKLYAIVICVCMPRANWWKILPVLWLIQVERYVPSGFGPAPTKMLDRKVIFDPETRGIFIILRTILYLGNLPELVKLCLGPASIAFL